MLLDSSHGTVAVRESFVKGLFIFDLDGALARKKSSLDVEMADHLGGLVGILEVAVLLGPRE